MKAKRARFALEKRVGAEDPRHCVRTGGTKMKIVIAAVSSNLCMSGVSRHASNLVRSILTRPEISSVHVLVASWEHEYVRDAISRSDPRLHIHAVTLRSG